MLHAQDKRVDVQQERNAALETMVRHLFDNRLFTLSVQQALIKIVQYANRAPIYNEKETDSLLLPKSKTACREFYPFLLDTITTLSIACANETESASNNSKSCRGPVLVLWKTVLRDLTTLHSVFIYAVSVQLLDLEGLAIDPAEAIRRRMQLMNGTAAQLGASEARLITLHQHMVRI